MDKQPEQINLFTRRKNRAKSIITPESQIQAAFFAWLKLHSIKYPVLDYFYAVPNGEFRFISTAVFLKTQGVKSGVPDCHLPVASADSRYIGLWFEFKSEKGEASDNQETWIAFLKKHNHRVEILKDWQIAANITVEHLDLSPKLLIKI